MKGERGGRKGRGKEEGDGGGGREGVVDRIRLSTLSKQIRLKDSKSHSASHDPLMKKPSKLGQE